MQWKERVIKGDWGASILEGYYSDRETSPEIYWLYSHIKLYLEIIGYVNSHIETIP